MNPAIIDTNQLPHNGNVHVFEGYRHGDVGVSFFLVDDMPSGKGPRLHSHPYAEVFIVQQGNALFTIGSTLVEVEAGQIVIALPGVPHKFINSGQSSLRLITIQSAAKMITTWLED